MRVRRGEAAQLAMLRGTPFGPGCSGFVKASAGILLASAFHRGREARVLRALRCLDGVIEVRGLLWCAPSCSANVLQAYAAHPDRSRSRGLAQAVRSLSKMQAASGSWPGMPFAATLVSLASTDMREARQQVKRALPLVRRVQNRDGSWGRGASREITTWQIVRALRDIEA